MASLTGGPLNKLNGDFGISAPQKSVPVMKLIRNHKPKSKAELVKLIADHHSTQCPCGVISQGSVTDFGKKLFDAQLDAWGEHRYSLEDCTLWEYNLFVVQSLKGNDLETKARTFLQQHLQGVTCEESDDYSDEELRIDLWIRKDNKIIAGVQVKPTSFDSMRRGVIEMNRSRNARANVPVLYLYYDYASERFTNLGELSDALQKLISAV